MIERLAVAAVAPLWLLSAGGAVSWWGVHWLCGSFRQPITHWDRPMTAPPAGTAPPHFVTVMQREAQ